MSLLHTAYAPEDFRKNGHALVDLLADHLAAMQSPPAGSRVTTWVPPAERLAAWPRPSELPGGFSGQKPEDFFRRVLAESIHLHHPRFMGHQVCAPAPLAALAGLLSEVLNNGMSVYEMGGAANILEKHVTDDLCRAIGWDERAGGHLTSGGTLGNLTALLAAREIRHDPDGAPPAVMVSSQAHYSIERAARVMGWGEEGIVRVPTDSRFRLRTDLLQSHYDDLGRRDEPRQVVAVVGSACSTSTGSYDDLEALAAFARRNNLWFHVDGAHGGAVVFSEKLRPLVRGIEKADSVVMDYHKMLLTPALATAVVFRKGDYAFRAFAQKAEYLFQNQSAEEWWNPGKCSFECTKYMMGLKIYTLLHTYGHALFAENVERLHGLATGFAEMVKSRPGLELAVEPESNIVCFRRKGLPDDDPAAVNRLNTAVRKQIFEEGHFYIVQTVLRGNVWLRASLMNPFTSAEDLSALLDAVETAQI